MLNIRIFGYSGIRLFTYAVIRLFGYSVIRAFGYLGSRVFAYSYYFCYSGIRLFTYAVIRLFGYWVIRGFGYSGIRVFGYLCIRVFGFPVNGRKWASGSFLGPFPGLGSEMGKNGSLEVSWSTLRAFPPPRGDTPDLLASLPSFFLAWLFEYSVIRVLGYSGIRLFTYAVIRELQGAYPN